MDGQEYKELVTSEYDQVVDMFIASKQEGALFYCEGKLDATIVSNMCRQKGLEAKVRPAKKEFFIVEAKMARNGGI